MLQSIHNFYTLLMDMVSLWKIDSQMVQMTVSQSTDNGFFKDCPHTSCKNQAQSRIRLGSREMPVRVLL